MYKMYLTQCLLALLSLYADLAHSFSWEIVTGVDSRLQFYDVNGTLVHIEQIGSEPFGTKVYDPVHNRVLFADNLNIFSFEIDSKIVKTLVTVRNTHMTICSMAYDPVTELLFWTEECEALYSISLKPGFNRKQLISSGNSFYVMTVDICGGFIHWISGDYTVQRARLDVSDKEILTGPVDPNFLDIDQQTQKLCWLEYASNSTSSGSFKCADLNGKNTREVLHIQRPRLYIEVHEWTFSKDHIYWQICSNDEISNCSIWQIPKNAPSDINLFIESDENHWGITAKYSIEDLTRGVQNCGRLKSLLPNNTLSNVSEESRCECAQGYSGERCDISVCHNYCLHGDCSASAEGQPKCRCYAGYSGERCEVYACQGYCLNSGVCSVNENSEPVCQCSGDYGGERCDVPVFLTKMKKYLNQC